MAAPIGRIVPTCPQPRRQQRQRPAPSAQPPRAHASRGATGVRRSEGLCQGGDGHWRLRTGEDQPDDRLPRTPAQRDLRARLGRHRRRGHPAAGVARGRAGDRRLRATDRVPAQGPQVRRLPRASSWPAPTAARSSSRDSASISPACPIAISPPCDGSPTVPTPDSDLAPRVWHERLDRAVKREGQPASG